MHPVFKGFNGRACSQVLCLRQLLERGNTDCLLCFRILSLACSPSGVSFVCSAAAQSPISHMDFSAVSSGGKSMNQVPGKLLLWDTKTMKQQVLAGFLSFLSLLAENECRLFLFLNYADFLFNTLLFPALPPFPSIPCRIKMNSVSSCGVWVGCFVLLVCWFF